MRKRFTVLLAALVLALAAACADNGSTSTSTGSASTGGDLTIVRAQDSTSMDNTTVFSNASIWVFQQIFESLYEVTPDGKGVQPLLATGYTLSSDKLTWTFKLKQGVKFSSGQAMTSADVKFSLDKARATKGGWEFLDVAINSVTAPDPSTVVVKTKYPWAPLLADLANFSNGIVPNNYGGKTHDEFYQAPVGTGPVRLGSLDQGQ